MLTIAGSDSGGGAGIQADLKTIMALGGYGASAITAITAQNSTGVKGWWPVPLEAVRAQVEAVVSDLGVDAVKTGMLGSAELANTVADLLSPLAAAGIPIVVDPVLASTHADALLTDDALVVLRERVVPLATVLTPNLGEVRALVGAAVGEEQGAAVDALLALGPRWVLVKGGHLPGEAVDLLADATERHELTAPRLDTEHTHGTGCSLAAAIATGLAGGKDVVEAVRDAKTWLHGAIAGGYGIGDGPGPVDHAWRWR
ncbi:MAG: bifunctional hydroxymethylpyrimidine kinase/phosphomethylpyrimidine kinase [Sporichthyaceae bacterium]